MPYETQVVGLGDGSGGISAPQPATRTSSTPPSLEDLPFEIQRLALSQAPTLDTLSALVHASPQFYRVYVRDRRWILRHFVEQSLGCVLVDAHAAYCSGGDEFQQTRTEPLLWKFLHSYQHRRATITASDLAAQLPLEDVIQLARFHHSVIEPLTERYSIWALAALSSSPEDPLSGIEIRRIQRALYRYEIFCNVCRSRGEGRSAPRYIRDETQRTRVLALFPAWQIEEILCIHEFAKDTYGGVFDRVAWDLDEERNPRYRHIDITSVSEDLLLFSYPECYINEVPLGSMLRQGLSVLSAVFNIANHDELVEMVRQSITIVRGNYRGGLYSGWIDSMVINDHQDTRRQLWYNEHDAAQDRKEKTPFDKDSPDLSPLAWVIFWQGEASNFFGNYVPATFRRWGFVMWDKPRLEASGALGHMEVHGGWPGGDTREDPYDYTTPYAEAWTGDV
ncbi:hypothetical protein B0I37DRAFT_242733 [Chaetomium sp. MPI-CAGE-AT-0009]|nr:hypothetical protein B0I37DRAFT_242733 [Chaetomium sp. MPI-CAGE-AT-0009]